MATNLLGVPNSNVIVPYTAATKRTKQYSLTVSGTNWTTTRAVGIAYADSLGSWRLRLNITGSISSPTNDINLTITGVTFKNVSGFDQSLSFSIASGTSDDLKSSYAIPNTSTVRIRGGNTISGGEISGDVELDSEPTWAAANMEGVLPVDVFVPSASASNAGLVDTGIQTFAGIKNNASMPAFWAGSNGAFTITGADGVKQYNQWSDAITNGFDRGSNFASNVFTVPTGGGGVYCFYLQMLFLDADIQAGSYFNIYIRKNSNTVVTGYGMPKAAGEEVHASCFTALLLSSGDTIDTAVAYTGTNTIDLYNSSVYTNFCGFKLF